MSETTTQSTQAASASYPMPVADEAQKPLAAVAYILTWITGLIIFFVAKEDQKYAKWNAIQAIGVGIVGFALVIVLNVVSAILGAGAALSPGGGFGLFAILGLLMSLVWLAMLILVILCAVKAYQGSPLRLPVLADFADKNTK